ncbi:MAG: DUF2309 domain-containing protein [Nitrospira sp.]|nr:DUF2309 domain-containing protein [Nitrospira sp.]
MAELEHPLDIESRRMELRGIVRLAGEVIAQYWPMRTFVHHNPLHGIEYLSFDEAVRRGKQFIGGNGYLPGDVYRRFLKTGRIQPRHLMTRSSHLSSTSLFSSALTLLRTRPSCALVWLRDSVVQPLSRLMTNCLTPRDA